MTSKAIQKLISRGSLEGFGKPSTIIGAAISTVFIFEELNQALKLYKGDTAYFKIGTGKSRIDFITKDFMFNKRINPSVYLDLMAAKKTGEDIKLVTPSSEDEDLVQVMRLFNTHSVFTNVLFEGRLSEDDAYNIGSQITRERLALEGFQIEDVQKDWYELFLLRLENIETWPQHIHTLNQELIAKALAKLRSLAIELEPVMRTCTPDKQWLSTDCTSENAYVEDGKLYFFDAFHPQPPWRRSNFNFDLIRVGTDIRVLAGNAHYKAYMKGVREVSDKECGEKELMLYQLFSSVVMGMYSCFRSETENRYGLISKKYLDFVEKTLHVR